nr:hypothetical protein [Tanacetum cinerariifolium]
MSRVRMLLVRIFSWARPSPTVASTSAEGQNKDSSTSEDDASHNTPKPFVKFVKPKDSQSEIPRTTLMTKVIGTVAAL